MSAQDNLSRDQFSGDRYVQDEQGHTHWGAHGAAGLLIYNRGADNTTSYLLQKRSPYVHEGGTWSTPGGALMRGEDPVEGAMREAGEEFGRENLGGLKHTGTVTDDHGGWAYHTVQMQSPSQFSPGRGSPEAQWESDGTRWVTEDEMQGLPLHPGFAASFARARVQ